MTLARETVTNTAAEAAGRRVLAYLRLLPMAEERRLELTLEVVRHLRAAGVRAGEAPARAMALLRELPPEPGLRPDSFTPSFPVFARGHMVPEEMDRRPWLSSAARLSLDYGRLAERVAVLKPRMLLAAMLSAVALLHLFAPALR